MKAETRLWEAQQRYAKESRKLTEIYSLLREHVADDRQLFFRLRDLVSLSELLQTMLITLAQDVTGAKRKEPTGESAES